jgi:GT2 family glycosyltransferase
LSDQIEVVVADNGSTDNSASVALSRSDILPGIRVVDASARRGRTAACNIGAAAARAPVLLFVDADDEVNAGYVSAMLRALQTADLAAASIDIERLNVPWVARTRETGIQDDGLSHYLDFLPISGGGVLGVRAEVFSKLGGLHEIPYAEDVDFSWRAQLAGHTLVGAPGAILHYRYRDSLRGIFQQAVSYGISQPLLYRMYRDKGMPRRSLRAVLQDAVHFARGARHLRTKSEFGAWLYLVGIMVGRARGSLRNRTLFL